MNPNTKQYDTPRGIPLIGECAQPSAPKEVESELAQLCAGINDVGEAVARLVDAIRPILSECPPKSAGENVGRCVSAPLAVKLSELTQQLKLITENAIQAVNRVEL